MRKSILGAGAALAFAAGAADAQTQPPAPVVPAVPSVTPGGPTGGGVVPAQYGADPIFGGGGAPVVVDGGPVYGGGGGPASRFYAEASYLLMWVNSTDINVPLATGGPSLGILGRPGTTVLLGNNEVDYDTIGGVKVAVGTFLGDTRFGFETSGFYIGRENVTQSVGPTSAFVIARPFFDPATRRENSSVIASPGAFAGGLTADNSIEAYGFENNLFWRVSQGDAVTLDVLAGFRYFRHEEVLNVYGGTTLLPGGTTSFNGFGVAAPGQILVHDRFGGKNTFYGGNLGARLSWGRGRFFTDLTGKIALGAVTQIASVDGSTTIIRGGGFRAPASTPGGFLTAGGNLGERDDTRFAVLPEGDIKIGFQLTDWANVFGGFSFMYLSSAARPQDQLGTQVAFPLTGLPTAPTYAFPGVRTPPGVVDEDLWFYGFNFGVTIAY